MSPPSNDESSGELPNSSEDNWMQEAYNQVEIADKANEEIQNAQQENLEHHSAEVVTNENVDYFRTKWLSKILWNSPATIPQVQNITPPPALLNPISTTNISAASISTNATRFIINNPIMGMGIFKINDESPTTNDAGSNKDWLACCALVFYGIVD